MTGFGAWLNEFSKEVVSGEHRALLALALSAILAGLAVTRKKFAGWMLLPIAAGAIWYGVIRWVQIRSG